MFKVPVTYCIYPEIYSLFAYDALLYVLGNLLHPPLRFILCLRMILCSMF